MTVESARDVPYRRAATVQTMARGGFCGTILKANSFCRLPVNRSLEPFSAGQCPARDGQHRLDRRKPALHALARQSCQRYQRSTAACMRS